MSDKVLVKENFETDRDDMVEGRNAVQEAIRAGRTIDKIFVAAGGTDRTLARIIGKAREAGIIVVETPRDKLNSMSHTQTHQGIIALCAAYEYGTIADMLTLADSRGEAPFIIICDSVSDPRNLGAIIRTSECAGAHGIIIPKRRSAGLSSVVSKSAAGAAEHICVARVSNLSAAIKELKQAGLWVYGAAPEAKDSLWDSDLKGAVCLVIGSEGSGIGRLVSENCDKMVGIPIRGKISSLNAASAAAILIYEVLRQRK